VTHLIVALAGLAVGLTVERLRARHRLAQLVDVDAVRAETIDREAVEQQLAEQTMRAAQFHRWWKAAQQVAAGQAQLLAARHRHAIPLGPGGARRPRHLRTVVPAYGVHRSAW
jgi:hypothetical protein